MAFPNDFFATLVEASSSLVAPPAYTNAMLECIAISEENSPRTVGETVNFILPTVNTADVTDIGNGALSLSSAADTKVSVSLAKNQSVSRRLQSFDQVRTPEDLLKVYLQPMLESLIRTVDNDICSLVTAGNFNSYTAVTGGTDTFTRANITSAWANVMGAGAPNVTEDLFFITSHVPYGNMASDSSLSQESIVGITAAESAQQRAVILRQMNAQLKWDQNFPVVSGGLYGALFFHRNAIVMRTAVEPSFNKPGYVDELIVYPKPNIPIKITTFPDPVNRGQVLAMNCVYGRAVLRPTYGSYLQST